MYVGVSWWGCFYFLSKLPLFQKVIESTKWIFLGPYRCNTCGKPYTYKKRLVYHQKFQCGEKIEFRCPAANCAYVSDLKSTLTRHIKLMHLPLVGDLLQKFSVQGAKSSESHMVYPCSRCNKVFAYNASLHDHQTYECGKEPQFKCGKEGCTYISHFKRNVALHIRHSHKVDYQEVYQRFVEQSEGRRSLESDDVVVSSVKDEV